MSIPPMTGGAGGAGPSRGRRRDIVGHFIRFGVKLVYERAEHGMKTLGAMWKRLVDGFKRAGSTLRDTSKGLDELGESVRRTAEAAAVGADRVSGEILSAAGATDIAWGAMRIFRGELHRTGNVLLAARAAVDYLATSLERLGDSMKKHLPESFALVEKDLKALVALVWRYRAALTLTGALLGGWIFLAKQASDVYDTFVDIFRLLTHNRRELEDMAQSFALGAAGMLASAEELRSTASAAFELGVRGSKTLQEFSETAFKLGRVLGLADSEAASLLRTFQIMRLERDEVDKMTVAMRLLQQRTGATARELAGVAEIVRTLSVTFTREQRMPFLRNMMELAAQFKMMKMDVNSSIAQITKFFDISDRGSRRLAAIFAQHLGMGVNEFIEGLKSGKVKIDDLHHAAENLVDRFGQNRAALDRATGGAAEFVYQLAAGAEQAREQRRALEEVNRRLGINQQTLDDLYKKQVRATNSMSTSWGYLLNVLGAIVAMIGAPLFNRLGKLFDLTTRGAVRLLEALQGIRDEIRTWPQWVKEVMIWTPLIVGGLGFLAVAGKVLGVLFRLVGGLLGLVPAGRAGAGALGVLQGAVKLLLSPLAFILKVLKNIVLLVSNLVGLGGPVSKAFEKMGWGVGILSGRLGRLLGFLGRILGPLGWILTAYQLLDPLEAKAGSLESYVKMGAMGAVAGGAVGSVIPGLGTVAGAGIGAGLGILGATFLHTRVDRQAQKATLPPPPQIGPTESQTGGAQTSNQSQVMGRPVALSRPESPVIQVHQADVVNAINDQTRALLLAFKELTASLATSALDRARARFDANDDIFERIVALEVR